VNSTSNLLPPSGGDVMHRVLTPMPATKREHPLQSILEAATEKRRQALAAIPGDMRQHASTPITMFEDTRTLVTREPDLRKVNLNLPPKHPTKESLERAAGLSKAGVLGTAKRPNFVAKAEAEVLVLEDGKANPLEQSYRDRPKTEREAYFARLQRQNEKVKLAQSKPKADNVYSYPASVYAPAPRSPLDILASRLTVSLDPALTPPPVDDRVNAETFALNRRFVPPSLVAQRYDDEAMRTRLKNMIAQSATSASASSLDLPYPIATQVPMLSLDALAKWHRYLLAYVADEATAGAPTAPAAFLTDGRGGVTDGSISRAQVSKAVTTHGLAKLVVNLRQQHLPPPAASPTVHSRRSSPQPSLSQSRQTPSTSSLAISPRGSVAAEQPAVSPESPKARPQGDADFREWLERNDPTWLRTLDGQGALHRHPQPQLNTSSSVAGEPLRFGGVSAPAALDHSFSYNSDMLSASAELLGHADDDLNNDEDARSEEGDDQVQTGLVVRNAKRRAARQLASEEPYL
jgi:hypothetical protein